MRTTAVVFEEPGRLDMAELDLAVPGPADVVVAVSHSGISSGTEKLLWQGRMPDFPGMGYPLVPGYEAVGTVVEAGAEAGFNVGATVFVPGSHGFVGARALFGAAAAVLVAPGARIIANDVLGDERGLLLALAATAHHALAAPNAVLPDLIIGHGTVGRLLARIAIAKGAPPPTVWEMSTVRRAGEFPYPVVEQAADPRRDYRAIYDCSGDAGVIDQAIGRLAKGGEIVLAGFYAAPVSFGFPPAFMREARLRIAAEFTVADMAAVIDLIAADKLSLDGLITDRAPAGDAHAAYERAFGAPDCLKMILDWSAA